MAGTIDRSTLRRARWLTLPAPGLGHLALGATWRAFFVGLPFLLVTHLFLSGAPFAGARLGNTLLLYLWYTLCYQVGAQIDLGRVARRGQPLRLQPTLAVVAAFVLVYALPVSVSVLTLATTRLGAYTVEDPNLFPVLRAGEVVLYRRGVEPLRSDYVVFERGGQRRAGRILGVPGDRVRVNGATVEINGTTLVQRPLGRLRVDHEPPDSPRLDAYHEQIEDQGYLIFRSPDAGSSLDRTTYLKAGELWLLCDQRDDAGCVDSRTLGPIHVGEVHGAPTHVLWSDDPSRIGFAVFSTATLRYE